MIGYIKGRVTALFKDFCFLETGGIGYRIFISDKTRQQLMTGEEAKLFTYMAVREDAILLYGFLGQEEQELFLLLISISKIGPKVAMGILSAMTPAAFVGAVKAQNVTQLTKLPGIGKKTAERLLVELKDKVGVFASVEAEISAVSAAEQDEGMSGEAARALMALGYEAEEIFQVPPYRIIGLIIDPYKLNTIRSERMKALGFSGTANYTDIARIEDELSYAKEIMRQLHCQVLDVSNKAIEETASRIMAIVQRNKELYGDKY